MESTLMQLEHQYLTFSLYRQTYGVHITDVLEVKAWEDLNALPKTPAYIPGVMNVRGVVIPVVDLRKRLGMPESAYDAKTVTIILRHLQDNKQHMFGIVVDGVSDVLDVDENSVQPVPQFTDTENLDMLEGITNTTDHMVVLLATEHILELGELSSLEQKIKMYHSSEEI